MSLKLSRCFRFGVLVLQGCTLALAQTALHPQPIASQPKASQPKASQPVASHPAASYPAASHPAAAIAGEPAWENPRKWIEAPLQARSHPASLLSVSASSPAAADSSLDIERPQRIGEPRDLLQASLSRLKLEWKQGEAGRLYARLAVRATHAGAVRVALQARPAQRMSLRVQGNAASQIFRLDSADLPRNARDLVWTPITHGDTQEIELTLAVPEGQSPPQIVVRQMSVFEQHPALPDLPARRKAEGSTLSAAKSASCSESVNCLLNPPQYFLDATRSVVRLVMTRSGVSFSCTGTLINDASAATQVPYVITAAHCVDSAETAATVNALFFYKTTGCASTTVANTVQLGSGAHLIYINTATDVALLRLNDLAPGGAYFSGWDPRPLDPGGNLVMIHHPDGGPQAFAVGTTLPTSLESDFSGDHMLVSWLTGSSTGGSSGGPMFNLQNGQYLVRGVLHGGRALCDFSGQVDSFLNRDFFSRLDKDAAGLSSVLQRAAAPLHDYSDIWIPIDELGWGISIYQGDDDRMLLAWYTQDEDGLPVWYLSLGGRWTSATRFEGDMALVMNSPALGPYDPARLATTPAGTLVLNFASRDSAEMTFKLAQGTRTKTLKRFRF